jgi:hypothetical protein
MSVYISPKRLSGVRRDPDDDDRKTEVWLIAQLVAGF